MGAELFHVDVRTDIHDEANIRFSKALKTNSGTTV